ncbi:argininosuccinate lyase [Haematospirillum sp. 15-248]|uniref:argininosuccinate lyase n=1 Tax=Haematospirillum sp. 15-248 TaxID=2723107 RepID=UPI00143C228A|nr:argininosuccinate lyase [Haematospirillum sp. 15-248]NKD86737.1 argininosuccinate lyase [Haematospirillum sp. 15-248]
MTNAVWGGRFRKPMDPNVARFNASLPFDCRLYRFDIEGSRVHARMLARQGLITQQDADDIDAGLVEILVELEQGGIPSDSMAEDIHMFIEQRLIEKTGDTGKKLHTGRSRNDQVALDLRLYARDAGQKVQGYLQAVHATLLELEKRHINDAMPGYTHLQQAQPVPLGRCFGAWAAMFGRDLGRLKDWTSRMNQCPLGAGALAGSTLPLDRSFVASELGFDGVIENTIDAVSDRDYIIEFHGVAALVMMHLSRLAEDMIVWASTEFGFVVLDDAFSTGSSLMPNKKNPDVFELVRGKSGRVFGNLMGMLTVMKALPLSYNKDMQEDKEGLFDTVDTLVACLGIMPTLLKSLTFRTDAMGRAAESGYLDATRILEDLVRQGVPFRDAHHRVGAWVAEAMDKECPLREVMEKKQMTS